MRMTILMKYHTLFSSKIRKDVAKFAVCRSCDRHFDGEKLEIDSPNKKECDVCSANQFRRP